MINKLMYVLLAFCLLLAGCRDEETATASQSSKIVKVVIPFMFLTPESAIDGQEGDVLRSATVLADPENDFRLCATDTKSTVLATSTLTRFNNTWILAFAQNGTCLSSENAGEVSPDTPMTASLPTGENMTLYILANGPSTLLEPTTLADFEGLDYYSTTVYTDESEVPYIGKISGVNVDENGRLFNDDGTDVLVPLKRIAAKLSISCTVGVDDYTIESVQLHNAPAKMFYVYSNDAAIISADMLNAGNVSGNTYIWFIGENLRGLGSSTDQFQRYAEKAPASSTFIRVTLRSTIGVETIAYDIYPGQNLSDNYDLVRNWDYIYTTTFNKSGSQLSSDKRVAVTGSPIDLTTAPSNCYVLLPGKSYKFDPCIKGEGQEVKGGTTLPIRHDADEVRLIWQDMRSLVQSVGISSDHSIAVVSLSPGLQGNAVVAAYMKGIPVWSWHLWIREKGLDVYTTNGVSGMACVLGALNSTNSDFGGPTSLGLSYQWGRNTPFPRAGSVDANNPTPVYDINNNPVSFDTSEGAQNISSVIEHPTTFFYTTVAGSSWHIDGDDLWGGNSGSKTIFDPCPCGWKIPQNNTIWNNWTSDTSSDTRFVWVPDKYARQAYEIVARGFYPAAGFYTNRPSGQPELINVGYEGRYWTGIFSGGKAGVLRFTGNVSSGTIPPDNNLVELTNIDQTYGCTVRPVKN